MKIRKSALEALHNLGAHLVLVRFDAKAEKWMPKHRGWLKTPASFDAAWLHVNAGQEHAIGVIPASLGCAVLDVDHGGQDACNALERALGEPLAVLPSKTTGRFHFWLRVSDAKTGRNGEWQLGDGKGEIRAAKGSITLWSDPAPLIAALQADVGETLSMSAIEGATAPKKARKGRNAPGKAASIASAPVGQRNEALNSAAFLAGVRGANPEVAKIELLKDAIDAGLPEDEAITTIDSGLSAGIARMRPMVSNDRDGLGQALESMNAAIRFNVLKLETEIRRGDGDGDGKGQWQSVNDRLADTLRLDLADAFTMPNKELEPIPFYLSRQRWDELINAFVPDINPVAQWLESLPPWDGVDRAVNWLADLFDLGGDQALAGWAARFVPLGVVWRTYEPGTKMDEMPVMIGPEGIGKSTVLRELLPPEMQHEWFSDSLQFAAPLREKAEALQGRVIVEAAEMAGIGRAQLDALKGFLSRTNDGGARLAFRRNPEPMLRRCVIVGTTNAAQPLPGDPQGNRRFIPVSMTEGDPSAIRGYMENNRDQIWAESLMLYRQGERAWLPNDLRQAQRDVVEQYRYRDDEMEDRVQNIIDLEVTLAGAAVRIGMIKSEDEITQIDQRIRSQLANVLQSSGRIKSRSRVKGKGPSQYAKKETVYILPGESKTKDLF